LAVSSIDIEHFIAINEAAGALEVEEKTLRLPMTSSLNVRWAPSTR